MAKIQWHPGFYGGIAVELLDYADVLTFQQEVELSKKPIRMDMLIIKKRRDIVIDHSIGRIFRKDNIIEYKGPGDRLSINELMKVIAYACLYKANSGDKTSVPMNDLTISVFRHAFPRELVGDLNDIGAGVDERYPGIYYISGLITFPIQIVVISRMEEGQHEALKILNRNASEADVRSFVTKARTFRNEKDRDNADAVLQVSVSANRDLYEHLRRESGMCDALKELMKEEIEAEKRESQARGEANGTFNTLASLVHDGLLNMKEAAKRANMSEDAFSANLKKMYG